VAGDAPDLDLSFCGDDSLRRRANAGQSADLATTPIPHLKAHDTFSLYGEASCRLDGSADEEVSAMHRYFCGFLESRCRVPYPIDL
jgi:hypothetical protein